MRTYMLNNPAVRAGTAIPISSLDKWWGNATSADADDQPISFYYERVPWLYRAVNLIADAFSAVPCEFVNSAGKVVETPRLPFALNLSELLNTIAGDITLYGAAYFFLEQNAAGITKRLLRCLPSTITPVYDAYAGVTAYRREVNGKSILIPANRILAVFQPSRIAEVGNDVAPARAALRAAGFLESIDAYGQAYFRNGALNPTLLSVNEAGGVRMTPEEREQLQSWLDRTVRGIRNAFRVRAVRSELAVTELGTQPNNLAMPELTDKKREDVSTALGVPHSLLFSNASTFATAQQDDLHFYDKTVLPLLKRVLTVLNAGLFADYGLTLIAQPERLEAYQMHLLDKAQALAIAHDRNIVTVNEFREEIGYARLEDARYDQLGTAMSIDMPADTTSTGASDAGRNWRDELSQWERFVMKRAKDGKRPARPFDARLIDTALRAALDSMLDASPTERFPALFADAHGWEAYP